jgi:GH24 family phage-related lysozyme (muramidase)
VTAPRKTVVAAAVVLAVGLAKPAEGLYRKAYFDPPGILTACWGHTGPDVRREVIYSLDQCAAWLDADMQRAINQVERCQPGLPVQVLASFSDAVFNMGPTIACDLTNSTAARLLAKARTTDGDYSPACRQLPRWDKARIAGVLVPLPGLAKRRDNEMTLCLQHDIPGDL